MWKIVPKKCIVGDFSLYQYTAIDEFSRFRYLKIYGAEFTKRLISKDPSDITMFEYGLIKNEIKHDLIKPYTLKHNGKVNVVTEKIMNDFILLIVFSH